jgi:hypothetical protein
MENEGTEGRPKGELERNLGEQPIAALLAKHNFKSADLVTASSMQLTHKMVSRACRGRRLTSKTRLKVHQAINALVDTPLSMKDLFNYK